MGIGMKELLIILAVALLVFGTKKLRNIGSDLGGAVKGFKKAMNNDPEEETPKLGTPSGEKDADFHSTADKAKSEKV